MTRLRYAGLEITAELAMRLAKLELQDNGKNMLDVVDPEYSDSIIVYLSYTPYDSNTFNNIGNGKPKLQEGQNILWVNLVQTRQLDYPDRDAAVKKLFFGFMKMYRERYDGYLVGADFANYELQELFKKAVENGRFPKESLNYIVETTQEAYDQSINFNITNKEFFDKVDKLVNSLDGEYVSTGKYCLVNASEDAIQKGVQGVIDLANENPNMVESMLFIPVDPNSIQLEYNIGYNYLSIELTADTLAAETDGDYIGGHFALSNISRVFIHDIGDVDEFRDVLGNNLDKFCSVMQLSFGYCTLVLATNTTITLDDLKGGVPSMSTTAKRLVRKAKDLGQLNIPFQQYILPQCGGDPDPQLMFRDINVDDNVVEIWRDKYDDTLYAFTAKVTGDSVAPPTLMDTQPYDYQKALNLRDKFGPYQDNGAVENISNPE